MKKHITYTHTHINMWARLQCTLTRLLVLTRARTMGQIISQQYPFEPLKYSKGKNFRMRYVHVLACTQSKLLCMLWQSGPRISCLVDACCIQLRADAWYTENDCPNFHKMTRKQILYAHFYPNNSYNIREGAQEFIFECHVFVRAPKHLRNGLCVGFMSVY